MSGATVCVVSFNVVITLARRSQYKHVPPQQVIGRQVSSTRPVWFSSGFGCKCLDPWRPLLLWNVVHQRELGLLSYNTLHLCDEWSLMHRGVDYIQPGPKEMDVKITQYLIRQERNVAKQTKKSHRHKFPRRKHKTHSTSKSQTFVQTYRPDIFFYSTFNSTRCNWSISLNSSSTFNETSLWVKLLL